MPLVRVLRCPPPRRPLVPSPGGDVDTLGLRAHAARTWIAAVAFQMLATLSSLEMRVICQPFETRQTGSFLVPAEGGYPRER